MWWKHIPSTFAAIAGTSLIPAACLSALGCFCVAKAVSQGTCCADDAYFASVAKNLASGPGYGSTVCGEGFDLFDPLISTGPAVILPAAGLITLFGNRPWVPGITVVVIWMLLLTTVFRVFQGRPADVHPSRLRDAGIFFLLAIPLLFPYHFEHWCHLLGEVPAALFLLLGFVILAADTPSIRTVAFASLACSLATLSKIIALPGYGALLLTLIVRLGFVERFGFWALATHLLASGVAFAGPIALFELVKMTSFGDIRLYGEHLVRECSLISQQGLPTMARSGALSRMVAHDGNVAARFGVSVFQSLVVSAAAFLIVLRSGRRSLIWATIPIGLTVGATAGWFLLFSAGWPRYFLVAMVLVSALIAIALASLESSVRVPAVVTVLALLWSVNYGKVHHLLAGLENGWFQPSNELRSAISASRMIDEALDDPGPSTTFFTQNWMTSVDIEYYSRHVGVFTKRTDSPDDARYMVVFNRKFRSADDEAFERLCERCESVTDPSATHVVLRSPALKDPALRDDVGAR